MTNKPLIFSTVFLLTLCFYVSAQTLEKRIQLGQWHPDKTFTALGVGDTVSISDDNHIRENDIKFSKHGHLEEWRRLAVCKRHKRGYKTSLQMVWFDLGKWSTDNSSLIIFIDKSTIELKEILQTGDNAKFVVTSKT